MSLPTQFTTEWILDDKQFKAEMRSAKAEMVKSFTDVKSIIDSAMGAMSRFGTVIDETFTRGKKFADLMAANRIGIDGPAGTHQPAAAGRAPERDAALRHHQCGAVQLRFGQ
jgi:hypothetical protein